MLSCVGVHTDGLNVLPTIVVKKVLVQKNGRREVGAFKRSWQRALDSVGAE